MLLCFGLFFCGTYPRISSKVTVVKIEQASASESALKT